MPLYHPLSFDNPSNPVENPSKNFGFRFLFIPTILICIFLILIAGTLIVKGQEIEVVEEGNTYYEVYPGQDTGPAAGVGGTRLIQYDMANENSNGNNNKAPRPAVVYPATNYPSDEVPEDDTPRSRQIRPPVPGPAPVPPDAPIATAPRNVSSIGGKCVFRLSVYISAAQVSSFLWVYGCTLCMCVHMFH